MTTNHYLEARLSPSGHLHLDGDPSNAPFYKGLQQRFMRNWREGWFFLAAERSLLPLSPSLQFWQGIAKEYLTQLCHLPEDQEFTPLETPPPDRLSDLLFRAPPIIGGEYLSIDCLRAMWEALNRWVEERAEKAGGIHPFLSEYAPGWQQVGRVCFHLAENKKDQERPFAFLATYSTGFGSTGQLKHLPLKRALEQYSGSSNRQALLKLLMPVHRAAESCSWVSEIVKTGEVYQPLAWSVSKAYKFLSSTSQLENSGLSVKIPNWWKKRNRPQVSITVGTKGPAGLGVNAMLDFNVEIALDGLPLTEEELREIASAEGNLVRIRGEWIEVDNEKLQEALAHWRAVQKRARNGEISFIDGMRLLAGAPSALMSDEEIEQQRQWLSIEAGEALAPLLRALRDPSTIPPGDCSAAVKATLRPYQREGVSWMALLTGLGLGACLADDMGLGKTLQILSLLVREKQQRGREPLSPSLLVVPASLLGNWKREAERFTPSLNLLFIHPSETEQKDLSTIAKKPESHLQGIDLVVTTYSMVSRVEWLAATSWNLLILDEAQAIKNSGTKQSRSTRKLRSRSRIALTGTPIENRLSDLFSLFDFLNPGLLGSAARFKEYVKVLEKGTEGYAPLRKLLAPYILRRLKSDPKIISDLPEKIETPSYCHLSKEQVKQYQAVVSNLKVSLENVEPKNRRGLILETLLRLKQICNHPSHYSGDGEYIPSHSGKFLRLGEICEELALRQERLLVFTQFSEIIEPLANYLAEIFGRSGLILHGGTSVKKRKELVEEFQREEGPPFFVLSLKAGGTGLTLTAASHVVHFDRWWNPAVENQATDRAFRIGQKKNVQVHKFIAQGTLEEQIDAMIASKRRLSEELLSSGEEVKITELSDSELLSLVTLDITKAQVTS